MDLASISCFYGNQVSSYTRSSTAEREKHDPPHSGTGFAPLGFQMHRPSLKDASPGNLAPIGINH